MAYALPCVTGTGAGFVTGTGAAFVTDQCIPIIHVLRLSLDDMDVPFDNRTWVDLDATMHLQSWKVEGGRESELEELDATTAEYVIEDTDRDLDPNNNDGPYWPDLVPNRMIWHQVQTLGKTYDVFIGFVNGFNPDYGRLVGPQFARIKATDGWKVLNDFDLERTNPDVSEFDELVSALRPSFYYRLGEPEGTKMVAHRKVIRYKKGKKEGKKKRVKKWKTRTTRAEVTGVSGPGGTYKGTPLLGEPGAIKGDTDTAVKFRQAQTEYARVQVDQSDGIDGNRLTVMAWAKADFLYGGAAVPSGEVISGPENGSGSVFFLQQTNDDEWEFAVQIGGGAYRRATADPRSVSVDTWVFLIGTWDGSIARLFINGVHVASSSSGAATLAQGSANGYLRIATGSSVQPLFGGTIDEPAVFERELTDARITMLYRAAFLGFDSSLTGQRVREVLALNDMFFIWDVDDGDRTMPPTRYAGLPPGLLIDEAEEAEGLPGMFFFSKSGVATFRDQSHRALAPFTSPLFTFTTPDGGQVPFERISTTDQDTFLYTIVQGTREGSEETVEYISANVGRYGPITLPLDTLPLVSDAETQSYVDALGARYEDPMLRIRELTLHGADEGALDALLTLDLSDCIRIIAEPAGGGDSLDQTSFVEKRTIEQSGNSPITGTFAVSPR